MDRDLVVRAQNGDRAAFTALATAGYGRLHKIAYTILRDAHVAEDAVQQTMLKVWTQLPQLRDPDRFEGWVHRMLVNTCRREGSRARSLVPDLGLRTEHQAKTDDIGAVIDRDQLDRGFLRLSLEHRTVLVLVYYADLPQETIAEALGIPVGTVKSRLHRATKELRAVLEADLRVPATALEVAAR